MPPAAYLGKNFEPLVSLASWHLHCNFGFALTAPSATCRDSNAAEHTAWKTGRLLWNSFLWTWQGCCAHELAKAVVAQVQASQTPHWCRGTQEAPLTAWGATGSWWLLVYPVGDPTSIRAALCILSGAQTKEQYMERQEVWEEYVRGYMKWGERGECMEG